MNDTDHNITSVLDPQRRAFLKRLAGASALALAASGAGLSLLDMAGPAADAGRKSGAGLGDFSIPEFAAGHGRMAVAHGPDRAATLGRALDALGGMKTFIKPGDHVLIKVNAAFASPADLGATTHPDLLAAVLNHCRQAGAAQVRITDNSINSPQSCFDISGLSEAARSGGAGIILPQAGMFSPVTVPGGHLIRDWPALTAPFQGVTKVLAVTPLKDHARAGASMTLKNFYGLLGGRRSVFHQDINSVISELSLLLKPTLCILDGTRAMISNGPTGGSLSDLKDTGVMIVSTDPVAADALGAEVLGRNPAGIPYIGMAAGLGAGVADYRSLNPITLQG